MNLSEAIALLDAVSDFDFGDSYKTPKFSIYDHQTEGFALYIKANLVNDKYRDYLKEIAKSRKIGIRESEGYLIIKG
jgi:hypothetical protein